jgi:hypothetical protein
LAPDRPSLWVDVFIYFYVYIQTYMFANDLTFILIIINFGFYKYKLFLKDINLCKHICIQSIELLFIFKCQVYYLIYYLNNDAWFIKCIMYTWIWFLGMHGITCAFDYIYGISAWLLFELVIVGIKLIEWIYAWYLHLVIENWLFMWSTWFVI